MPPIMIHVQPEEHSRMLTQGRRLGYLKLSEYIRSVMLREIGAAAQPPAKKKAPLTINQELILETLAQYPRTMAQIARDTGKHPRVVATEFKLLSDLCWIIEERRDVWTGGRPASSYKPTETGLAKLEEMRAHRKKLEEDAERVQRQQREESARKDPDVPRLRSTDLESDEGKYTQACLDSLYKFHPNAKPEWVQRVIALQVALAVDQVKECGSTWEQQYKEMPQSAEEWSNWK